MWWADGRLRRGADRGYAALPQVAEQHAERRGGSEHPLGGVVQGDDSEELLSHRGVTLGREQHPAYLRVDDPDG